MNEGGVEQISERAPRSKPWGGVAVIACLVSLGVWGGIWGLIPQVRWGELSVTQLSYGVLASLLVWWARAARLWALGACSWMTALRVVAVHGGLLRVTPMRLGELSLPYLLQRWAQVPMTQSSALLIWIRISELITLCVAVSLCLAGVYFAPSEPNPALAHPALVLVIATLCVGLLTLVLSHARRWISSLCLALDHAGQRSGRRELSALSERLRSGQRALPELTRQRGALLLGISGLIFTAQLLLFWSVLSACGASIDLSGLTLGSAITHIGGVLPLPTIGNVGSHELSWTAGFMWVGVTQPLALLSAILSQIFTLSLALLWWAVSYFLPLPSKECEGRSVVE